MAGPYVNEVRREHGAPGDLHRAAGPTNEPPRPPALPAFIVEAGLVGVALFVINGLWTLVRPLDVFRGSGLGGDVHWRPLLLIAAILPLIVLWAVFVEIQDYLLLYLLLMPYGVLDAWTHDRDDADGKRTEARIV
jgi:hypothetical protein